MGSISINPVVTPSFTITPEVTGDERLTASAPGRGKTIVTVDQIIDKAGKVLGTGGGGPSSGYPVVEYKGQSLKPNTYYKAIGTISDNIVLVPQPFSASKIKQELQRDLHIPAEYIEFIFPYYIMVPLDVNKYLDADIIVSMSSPIGLILTQPTCYIKMNISPTETMYLLICKSPYNNSWIVSAHQEYDVLTTQDAYMKVTYDGIPSQDDEILPVWLTTTSVQPLKTLNVATVPWLGDISYRFISLETLTTPFTYNNVTFKYRLFLESVLFDQIVTEVGVPADQVCLYVTEYKEGGIVLIVVAGEPMIDGMLTCVDYNLEENNNTLEYILDGVFEEYTEFNFPITWTNDNPPTFDGTTRHVISILDGVGCYTVTPIEETT